MAKQRFVDWFERLLMYGAPPLVMAASVQAGMAWNLAVLVPLVVVIAIASRHDVFVSS